MARDNLEKAAQLDPTSPYPWASLAETYLRLKQPERASEAAVKAEKLGAQNPVVWHALAMFYSESGQFEHAAKLEAQYSGSPRADAGALGRAASLYLESGDPHAALDLAQAANERMHAPETEDLLGRALLANNQNAEGLKHLQAAWQAKASDPQIAFDYAQALLKQQNFAEAASVIEPALAANPEDAQLELALGVTRYGQRRFEDAIVTFLRVIDMAPDVPQPYEFLGRMLDQAGNHLAEITAADERLLARDPKNAKANLLLAKALLVSDHLSARADTLLRNAIQLDAGDWESHYELGTLLASKHQYKEAASELQASIKLNPSQAMPHYHLARVYDRLGETQRADEEREIHKRLTSSQTNR